MGKLTAQQYFDMVKDKKVKTNDNELKKYYENAEKLLHKSLITSQTSASKKLIFHLETIEKERKLVKMGIDTFVYKDDIEEFIDNIAKDTVKIIELERYEREIPDEVVGMIRDTKELFDKFYIVFTDYTGKIEKEALKERAKEKDPILFGTFQDKNTRVLIDRFYFIADWEDEYCDLTLDKMVAEMKNSKSKNIERKISTPTDLEEIKKQLYALDNIGNDNFKMTERKAKPTMFDKIKTFLNRG